MAAFVAVLCGEDRRVVTHCLLVCIVALRANKDTFAEFIPISNRLITASIKILPKRLRLANKSNKKNSRLKKSPGERDARHQQPDYQAVNQAIKD